MAGATLEGAASGPLAPALAVSVALHAAALAGLPDIWSFSDPPAPPPLMAWLAPGAPPATTADAPLAEAVEQAAAAPPRVRERAASKAAAPRRAPIPAPPAPDPAPATPVASAPPSTAPAAPLARSIPAAPTASRAGPVPDAVPAPVGAALAPAPESGPAPVDVGSLVAQYRLALIGAAKRDKTYPARAVDRGWEGRVEIRLVIGSDGELARALVQRSSGHDVLDRQTLEMFRAAHAVTPVPSALRNREFAVEVAVRYELKDGR